MRKLKFYMTPVLAFLIAVALVIVNISPAAAETAEDNYSLYCVQCHGTAGVGKGINAPFLNVQPRNHTSVKDMGALSDENIAKAIKGGGLAVGKSNQMPSWGAILSDADIADMVKLLRKKCKCKFTPPPA